MPDRAVEFDLLTPLIRILLGWSLLSLGTSVVGLYARAGDFFRGLWFMSGLWGLIDGAIGLFALCQPPMPVEELRWILGVNALLDVAYLAVGAWLGTRAKPLLKGFGVAILVQGAFLLMFDTTFWYLCRS